MYKILWNTDKTMLTYDLFDDCGNFVGNFNSESEAMNHIPKPDKKITCNTYERACKRMEYAVKNNCGWKGDK